MEALYLVCGAGGPQLKRNPLGCILVLYECQASDVSANPHQLSHRWAVLPPSSGTDPRGRRLLRSDRRALGFGPSLQSPLRTA